MSLKETPPCHLGWIARPFSLKDAQGGEFTLGAVSRPTLIMFICNHCPYVKVMIRKIKRDTDQLKEELGVDSVAVMSNDTKIYTADSFDEMKVFAEEHQLNFPYVIDETQDVAREYGAVCTPDFFGFNSEGQLQYRGRLDSSGMKYEPEAERELFEAMKMIAQTGKGPLVQNPSMGCSIKWKA